MSHRVPRGIAEGVKLLEVDLTERSLFDEFSPRRLVERFSRPDEAARKRPASAARAVLDLHEQRLERVAVHAKDHDVDGGDGWRCAERFSSAEARACAGCERSARDRRSLRERWGRRISPKRLRASPRG